MHSVILHRFCSPVVLSHTLSVAVAAPAALLSVLVLSAVVLRHELLLHAYSTINNHGGCGGYGSFRRLIVMDKVDC